MNVYTKVTTTSVTVTEPKNVRNRRKERRKECSATKMGGLYATVLSDTLQYGSGSYVFLASKENLPNLGVSGRGIIPMSPITHSKLSTVMAIVFAVSNCMGSSCR